MSTPLLGKVALVTGASRGIGAAIALRLAADGADVAFTYRAAKDAADSVADRIRATGRRTLPIMADSADPAAVTAGVRQAANDLGRLDILVSNAAAFPVGPIESVGTAEIDHALAVNLRAPLLAVQAAVPHLRAGGRIITIGSNLAERSPFPGFALYSMTKTALAGLTRALGRELGPRGITVNLVNPGPTDTDANPADGPQAGGIAALTAVGRYAEPAEIADAVAFLAGPSAAYITAAVLNADGGFAA